MPTTQIRDKMCITEQIRDLIESYKNRTDRQPLGITLGVDEYFRLLEEVNTFGGINYNVIEIKTFAGIPLYLSTSFGISLIIPPNAIHYEIHKEEQNKKLAELMFSGIISKEELPLFIKKE